MNCRFARRVGENALLPFVGRVVPVETIVFLSFLVSRG
jgi:hypothetical protein